jgi:hypothetical protein
MAVRCSHCGEELMGAVNRCWKCGRAFSAQPTSDGLPPVRRVPLATVAAPANDTASNDTVTSDTASGAPEGGNANDAVVKAQLAADSSATNAQGAIRRGSPFSSAVMPVSFAPHASQPAPLVPLSALPLPSVRKPPRRGPNYVATGGAVGGIVLGLFALALAPFRAEAALVALIGMVMGLWGLYSPKRGWALVGLLICCLAIGLASYTGAKALNTHVNRNQPWDPDAVEYGDFGE